MLKILEYYSKVLRKCFGKSLAVYILYPQVGGKEESP